MQPLAAIDASDESHPVTSTRVAWARLGLGVLQGLVLYFLYHATKTHHWPANEPLLFAPLLVVFVFVPVLVISGLGHIPAKTLGKWVLAATLIAAGLGFHDSWRINDATAQPFPTAILWTFGVAGFFIAHALVLAAATDQRRIASYPSYFDSAWKLLVQMMFSGLFVGVSWIVLWLGAELFKLIKLNFLQDLLKESWFAIPFSVFAFACAMQLTDVRPSIVRGIRNLLLVLLSWILPIALLIIGGFLLSLPFTGLTHLWETKHATQLLLSAAAALVILINAAFQNGAVADQVTPVLRVCARLASVLLLPLVAIAAYALGLRVADYGWTTDRIIASSCLLVAACYAVGYAWAAGRKTDWLKTIAPVNIATAFVILGVLLALFSPVLDPARISVADQVARLESGKQTAKNFDFEYLKFQGRRYGLEALKQLSAQTSGVDAVLVRERAIRAIEKKNPWDRSGKVANSQDLRTNLTVWPRNRPLPESFLAQDWANQDREWQIPQCLTRKSEPCDVYQIDFYGDGKVELFVVEKVNSGLHGRLFELEAANRWKLVALTNDLANCSALFEQLQRGEYKMVEHRLKDVEIAGKRISLRTANDEYTNCTP